MDKDFKDLLCKDDDCLKLVIQIKRTELKPGIIIRGICHRCGKMNEWRFGYTQLEEEFDKLNRVMKGGEK